MLLLTRARLLLTALTLLASNSCTRLGPTRPAPTQLTDLPVTSAQQAVVRQYLDLVAAERYADAWQLLTPERQGRETPEAFAADWRAWGRVVPEDGSPFIWPAAEDQVRAEVWIQYSAGGGSRDRVLFDLQQVGGMWRIADEHGRGHHERGSPTTSSTPTDLARTYVAGNYGSLWLSTLEVLDEEPFEDGQVVVFRVLDPLLEPRTAGPRPTAILLFALPQDGGWHMAGGGSIGTIIEMGRYAVACAWTWLRFIAGPPTIAAFYCTVEEPRVAASELERVDGAVQRVDVVGKRAVVFPYAWDMQSKWPAQQPHAIRLFDTTGAPLALMTSLSGGGP